MENFTYSQLVEMIPSYMERPDAALSARIPTFIALAERRIATELKQQGFQAVVTGTLPTTSVMSKPTFWKSTISFNYTTAAGKREQIKLRSLEYVRNYWPDPALTGSPRFYADYNATHFLLGPTPPVSPALTFELVYYAMLEPLTDTNDSNWMTLNIPQVLFSACMVEACRFAKSAKQAVWEDMYQGSVGSLKQETAERTTDRNVVVTRG